MSIESLLEIGIVMLGLLLWEIRKNRGDIADLKNQFNAEVLNTAKVALAAANAALLVAATQREHAKHDNP